MVPNLTDRERERPELHAASERKGYLEGRSRKKDRLVGGEHGMMCETEQRLERVCRSYVPLGTKKTVNR